MTKWKSEPSVKKVRQIRIENIVAKRRVGDDKINGTLALKPSSDDEQQLRLPGTMDLQLNPAAFRSCSDSRPEHFPGDCPIALQHRPNRLKSNCRPRSKELSQQFVFGA